MANRVVMPKLTDTMEEGVVLRWYKKEGERVESGEAIAEIETDKAVMDLEAFASGIVKKILEPEGSKVPSGNLIAIIAAEDEEIDEILAQVSNKIDVGAYGHTPLPPKETERPALLEKGALLQASPFARKMAKEHGIDLSSVTGSGPGGKITQKDIEQRMGETPVSVVPEGVGEIKELSILRKAVAKKMVQSKGPIPHFYVVSEIDMENLLVFKEEMVRNGIKLTVTELFIKAVALTLRKFPAYRSCYLGDSVRIANSIDVGFAIGIPDGVITAVVFDCDHKTLSAISDEVRDKIKRAQEKGLSPSEYTGAVFSISNLGKYDVESFSAILSPPESGVLAIGSILEKPVVSKGEIRIGKTVKVTLSTDHRVADGVLAAQFLSELKAILQNPKQMAV